MTTVNYDSIYSLSLFEFSPELDNKVGYVVADSIETAFEIARLRAPGQNLSSIKQIGFAHMNVRQLPQAEK
jgi:hypothetical protein